MTSQSINRACGVDVLAVMRKYRSADAVVASAALERLLSAFSSLLASHRDYTSGQESGWPGPKDYYPDLKWSQEIEREAEQALASARGHA